MNQIMMSLVKLPDINTVAPITDNLDDWTIQDGKPEMKTWILNTSNDERDFWLLRSYARNKLCSLF